MTHVAPVLVMLVAAASCSSSIATRQVETSLGVMAYEEFDGGGGASDLLLIHGTPANSSSYEDLLDEAEKLAVDTIVVVDRIGFGASDTHELAGLEEHAASVVDLIDALALVDPIVVGHSYGGPVALKIGTLAGDRIGGLVLLAGACDPEMDDPKWFRGLVDGISFLLPRTWAYANRELYRLNDDNVAMRSELDGITVPVAVVHGTLDLVCPHESTVEYLRTTLVSAPEVRVVSRSGYGHNVQRSSVEEIVAEINRIAGVAVAKP